MIWEAYRLKNRVVQYCTEVQLGLAILYPLLVKAHLLWTAYWFAEFTLAFNVITIGWFIILFKEDSRYEA